MSVQNVTVVIDLLLALTQRMAALSSIIQAARAEGREKLTDAEWKVILAADDQADARLAGLIAKASGSTP